MFRFIFGAMVLLSTVAAEAQTAATVVTATIPYTVDPYAPSLSSRGRVSVSSNGEVRGFHVWYKNGVVDKSGALLAYLGLGINLNGTTARPMQFPAHDYGRLIPGIHIGRWANGSYTLGVTDNRETLIAGGTRAYNCWITTQGVAYYGRFCFRFNLKEGFTRGQVNSISIYNVGMEEAKRIPLVAPFY